MKIRLGTRGSKLALIQANQIKEKLEIAYPQHEVSIVVVQTRGDKDQKTPLHAMSGSGVFVKELEQQLFDHQIDIAVHSMKDLPAELAPGLRLCDGIIREDARDVLVTKEHVNLAQLPLHAKIATGSLRRKYQLLQLRPDLQIESIRGNIDTRLRLLQEQDLDGIIVAAAAMHRLHRTSEISMYFDETQMVPAACQGAIGLEIRAEEIELYQLIQALADPVITKEIAIERAFLTLMEGGCHTPMGARCHIGDDVHLLSVYGTEDGSSLLKHEVRGKLEDAFQLVQEAVALLKKEVL